MKKENDYIEAWIKTQDNIETLKEIRRDHVQAISNYQEEISKANQKVAHFSRVITEKTDKIEINRNTIARINKRIKGLKKGKK